MKTWAIATNTSAKVLVAKDDVIIIDFEGEPSRSLMARRGKHSPLRDVVELSRSFNYAAHAACGRPPPMSRDRAVLYRMSALGNGNPRRVSGRLRHGRRRQSGVSHRSRPGQGAAGTVHPGEGLLRAALRTG
ncbi:MAG: hypothetical protein MZW92_72175 [Comamonadaceae bacterium]|nr:hypothetical protein [Comamonadaceae bacterium]